MKRFFFHYYRQYKCMSVHFDGKCYKVDNVDCRVPCETKWNKRQPNLIMRGYCNNITIENKVAVIS